ncbi:hypothetical protein O1L60_31155 [Streptomyces diastatochromogenes]|nr:hypothetical protein [Streptomyces diastatochromogenes]
MDRVSEPLTQDIAGSGEMVLAMPRSAKPPAGIRVLMAAVPLEMLVAVPLMVREYWVTGLLPVAETVVWMG